jgi:hypothetical protein
VLDHIEPGADLIVGCANGEPQTVIDAIEAGAVALSDVRIHQMLPVRPDWHAHTGGSPRRRGYSGMAQSSHS